MACTDCQHCEEVSDDRRMILCGFPLPPFITIDRWISIDSSLTCRTFDENIEVINRKRTTS